MTLDDINRLDTERTSDVWLGLPEMKKASTGGENQQSGTIREMWRPKAATRHGLFRVGLRHSRRHGSGSAARSSAIIVQTLTDQG
jgi:hypothetical protein